VAGPDAEDYLQRMVSNDVTAGELVDALLLTPKGRLIAPVRVWRRGPEDFLLLTEPELGEVVRATLLRSRFAAKCEIELEEHTSAVVFGEADGLSGELPGTVEVLDADVTATVGEDELERARIEAGVPSWGKELDDSILPAEAGLDETHISFTKGCYPGQEPIARLRNRGHVNRRLWVLEVERARPGGEIRYEGRAVGRVTSAVPGLALGFVRTEIPDEAELEIDGVAARPR
jgi:folate-binding protein YgfZ